MSTERTLGQYLLPLVVFVITFGFGLKFMGMNQTIRISESRLERQLLLAEIRSEIERHLDKTLAATELLAHEVVRTRGHLRNFEQLTEGILEAHPGIANLQLAPGGVVRKIHPLAGNVEALGHDILGDQRINADVFSAVKSGRMTLAGPLNLVQGGVAVIARKPVYFWDSPTQPVSVREIDRQAPFWGFVSAMIMFDELLDAAPTLDSLAERGYSHHFSRFDARKKSVTLFAQNGSLNEAWSDRMDIRIPNGQWTLTIGNDSAVGSGSAATELAMTIVLALLLAGGTGYYLQRQGAQGSLRTARQATTSEHR